MSDPVQVGNESFNQYLEKVASREPKKPAELVDFWRNETERLQGELYRNRNNGQIMRMLDEAERQLKAARSANFNAYVDEKAVTWSGGVIPKKRKPFEGMAEMIQKAQGVKQE